MFYHRQDPVRSPTSDYRFTAVLEVEFKNDRINLISYVDDLAKTLNKRAKYTNLNLNKNAFQSRQNTGFEAGKVIDERNNTRQTTAASPSDVTIDFRKRIFV